MLKTRAAAVNYLVQYHNAIPAVAQIAIAEQYNGDLNGCKQGLLRNGNGKVIHITNATALMVYNTYAPEIVQTPSGWQYIG